MAERIVKLFQRCYTENGQVRDLQALIANDFIKKHGGFFLRLFAPPRDAAEGVMFYFNYLMEGAPHKESMDYFNKSLKDHEKLMDESEGILQEI